MDSLIRFALGNRALVLVSALLLTAYGGWVGRSLPVDVFPDLSAPTVTIVTEAHGMTPVVPPVTRPWGQTVGWVRDAEGVLVEIASIME